MSKKDYMASFEVTPNLEYETQSSGLPDMHAPWNLKPVWPDEHSAIDKYRHKGG